MSYILGVSLGNNTSACLINETGILFAISEERLNGEKNTKKFPILAIKKCWDVLMSRTGGNFPVSGGKVIIAISSYEVIGKRIVKYIPDLNNEEIRIKNAYTMMSQYIARHLNIMPELIKFRRVAHHDAHKYAGVYMSGFMDESYRGTPIAISYDGFGDGVCGTIQDMRTNEILSMVELRHSMGLVYQFVTGRLGFKEHQHEGKITGLAAFGQSLYVELFKRKLFEYSPEYANFVDHYDHKFYEDPTDLLAMSASGIEINHNIHRFQDFLSLRQATYNLVDELVQMHKASREDIAASVQIFCEQLMFEWVWDIMIKYGMFSNSMNVVLSGGLFANVKINGMLKQMIPAIDNLFVCPPMGDEGTCVGAAVKVLIEEVGISNVSIKGFAVDRLYRGMPENAYTFEAVQWVFENEANFNDYTYLDITANPHDDVAEFVADKVNDEKVVCISRGSSEFGPRALGNHSILYDATHFDTNAWLNARLDRTEFMPFAPIVADVFAKDLFKGIEGLGKSLKYMTVALDVTDEFKDNYKAACHVDHTARPQVVSPEDNPFIYNILMSYYKNSKKKAMVNTSYNLHNHPIIADDLTAIRSFIKAGLDVLVLENAIIVKK